MRNLIFGGIAVCLCATAGIAKDKGIVRTAWTDRLNENGMYPSSGLDDERGVIVGAYVAGWTHQTTPEAFVKLPIAEQIRISAGSIEALHPGKSRFLTAPVAINWGPITFAGQHLSYVGLWQEGSALSAHEAVKIV